METASTNVLANCDIPLQEQNSLGNLETSDDMSDTRSRKTLDNDFHSYENESCVDDYYDDCFAFEKIEYKVPTPKINISEQQLVATTIMVVDTIHNHESTKLLRVLFDSGGSRTMINRRVLPKGVIPMGLKGKMRMNTLAGTYESGGEVYMKGLRLPELDKSRTVEGQRALVFDADCRYDVILGNDFINRVGIDILGSNGTVEWLGNSIPMRSPPTITQAEEDFNALFESYLIEMENDHFGFEPLDNYASKILDAKYDKVDVKDVAQEQAHLTATQRNDLERLLKKHEKLFSGKLGLYPHKKFNIELLPGAEPVHSRPYPVPRIHEETFRKELDHLVEIGVLSFQGASEWACPSFIQPKKDGRVRWISDLRALNNCIKRK